MSMSHDRTKIDILWLNPLKIEHIEAESTVAQYWLQYCYKVTSPLFFLK